MYTKHIIPFLILLAVGIPLTYAQECTDCMPISTVHDVELYNPCGGASQAVYCSNVIRKTTKHTIAWPDGYIQAAYLTAYGSSACAGRCMKDWIGAPWTHRDCWPDFYSPVQSSKYYYAAAADNSTNVIMAWCYAMAYAWAVYCTGPTGRYHYISIDHRCMSCVSGDMDNDGYISTAAGGDDCNDSAAYINPGAAPICYPGFDVNCNGIQDFVEPPCSSSPVALDLGKDGIALTSKTGGVPFDLDADGIKENISWTAGDTDDAWLALDRNGNRVIDDGTELFGNYTPQPDPPQGFEPNGFLALAVYDTAANGGNGNGVIDASDSIYRDLLLWRDSNHNGISEPDELKTLQSSGVTEISLEYKLSRKVDEYGNQYRYRAKVKLEGQATIDNWAWDVFLLH